MPLQVYFKRAVHFAELAGIVLTICLLPIDRFPYLHYIPLRLGSISLALLLVAAAARGYQVIYERRWLDLKRIATASFLLILPVAAYAFSIHYSIDHMLAHGATKLLLIADLKALCLFILLYENRALFRLVKNTIYVVTALIVAYGFFQFVFDIFGASQKVTDLQSCCTSNSTYIFPRVHSVSLEPLYFANFLLLPIWLMLVDFFNEKSFRKNKWLAFLFAATAALFVLSLARSAYLALLVSGLIFLAGLGGPSVYKKLRPYVLRGAGLVVIIALFFVLLSGVASKVIHKHALNGSNSGVQGSVELFGGHAVNVLDQSAQTRYSTWPKAFTYFKEKPLQGVGAYNSRVRLNLSAYNRGVQDIQLQPFNNDFLGLLVDLGLLGLIAFAPLVVGLVLAAWRVFKLRWKDPSAPFILAAIAMLVQSNFFQSILLARLWVVVGVALVGLYHKPAKREVVSK